MDHPRKNVIITILIATFIFLVSFGTLYAQNQIMAGTACDCSLPIPLLIPTLSSLGVLIGSIVYYTLIPRIEKDMRRVEEGEKKKYEASIDSVLDLLDTNEKQVIKSLIDGKGRALQSKLSRDLGKVKAFRTIESLRKRGVVEKRKYGKTNQVVLADRFRVLLD